MYRLHQAIAVKKRTIPRGSLVTDGTFAPAAAAALMARGVISQVEAPPLAIIPGWKVRADRLARVGIITVADFLDADIEVARRALRVGDAALSDMREGVMRWLIADNGVG